MRRTKADAPGSAPPSGYEQVERLRLRVRYRGGDKRDYRRSPSRRFAPPGMTAGFVDGEPCNSEARPHISLNPAPHVRASAQATMPGLVTPDVRAPFPPWPFHF
jgi:hypothetical protein